MANRWTNRWRNLHQGDSKAERGLAEIECAQAEAQDTRSCLKPGCGGTGHYRPGVGGWWCNTCGDLVDNGRGRTNAPKVAA